MLARFVKIVRGCSGCQLASLGGGDDCDGVCHNTQMPPMSGLFSILLVLVLGMLTASAQQTAVCSNMPGTAERIECTQDVTSTNDIDIDVDGVDIKTTGEGEDGIKGLHAGTGDITIDVTGTDTIMTGGTRSRGIFGHHTGHGAIGINLKGSTRITTTGTNGHGIITLHQGAGDVEINLTNESRITTVADHSAGIYAKHEGSQGTGHITIMAQGGSVTTRGRQSIGITAWHEGTGDIVFDLKDLDTITDSTEVADEILSPAALGLYGLHDGTGDIAINAIGGSVMTRSLRAIGVGVLHRGSGDILIDLADVDITTESERVYSSGRYAGRTRGHGVLGWHLGTGDIDIDARGGSVTTRGAFSYGLYGVHQGEGDVDIASHDGHTITTTGANSHGIVAHHYGELDTRSMAVSVGGTIHVSGEGAQGVRVGFVNADGVAERVAALGEDGYRQQTVTVNGPVTGKAAGVFLAGGGKVFIGPQGTVGADSGIAILATGDTPGANMDDSPIKPKLLVDMDLDGRRVADVIDDDWIINDGGETTIVVNDVTLHDGATGVTGNVAPNGAFDVTMRDDGLTVDASTSPWTMSQRSTSIIADRDFSAEDFVAPRAALYELLPDFLLRLSGQPPSRRCRATPAKPVWVRFAGGQGAYQADRSTTGATYEFDRFETEGGLSASLNERVKGWASVRYVRGAAGGASPTGGGEIDARGLGSTVGGAWTGANGAYAVGCFSYMGYTLDVASTNRGMLRAGVNGRAYTLDFEAGRRLALNEQVYVTPRVWVVGARVSVDRFTDTVNARVAVADADRVLAGLGVRADTTRPWGEGAVTLRGSVDYERIVSGAETTTTVSGEKLRAEATDNSLLLGLNGVYRQGRFSVGAAVSARQELGSTDSEYVGFLNLGISF